jgi:hypothetical protein
LVPPEYILELSELSLLGLQPRVEAPQLVVQLDPHVWGKGVSCSQAGSSSASLACLFMIASGAFSICNVRITKFPLLELVPKLTGYIMHLKARVKTYTR